MQYSEDDIIMMLEFQVARWASITTVPNARPTAVLVCIGK